MKKKLSRQDAIYSIALAGISAGLALLLVWLGVAIKYSTIAFFVAASLVILVPMTKKYYLSSLIAYGVSAGLSFIIVGDIIGVIGYILYFGPIGLLTGFLYNLNIKLWIQEIIKLVFINGILAALYFGFGTLIIGVQISKIDYWIVAIVGSIVLLAIDFVVQLAYKRMIVVVAKALRKNEPIKEEKEDEDSHDPFDDGTFED